MWIWTWRAMKHQLYKYSTNQLMISSFTGELCDIRCPQLSSSPNFSSFDFHLSHFTVQWLTLWQKSLSDFSDLNTTLLGHVGLVTHSSLLQELVSKFRVKSAMFCSKATSESSSSSILMTCGCRRCEHLRRVEWSDICSPVLRGVKPG